MTMERKIINDVELVEPTDTGMISMTGGRISKTGREQIEKAEQIIILKASKHLENSINKTELYDELFVALIVDRVGTRTPVKSGSSSWYFNDEAKAIRSIKRINKSVEIITMKEVDYQKLLDKEAEHFKKVVGAIEKLKEQPAKHEISLKIGSTMLHVNYINGVFETGFYDQVQTNKPKKELISNSAPKPIYDVVFRSINSFATLEEAEAFVMKENMVSFLRANTDNKVQAFLKAQNKIDEQEMLKHAEDFEKDLQQRN